MFVDKFHNFFRKHKEIHRNHCTKIKKIILMFKEIQTFVENIFKQRMSQETAFFSFFQNFFHCYVWQFPVKLIKYAEN